MADENQEVVEEKKSGNGLMVVLIALIVILLLAVGGIGYLLYSKGILDPQTPQQAGQEQVAEQKQAEAEEEGAEKFNANIDNLVLNVSDAKGRSKLMKMSFTVHTTEPTIESQIEKNKAQITDIVIKQVSARSSEELLTVGGKAMLKEEMIEEINNIINDNAGDEEIKKDCIKDIFFTSFVIK